MARFTAKSNPIRPPLSVLPKSITILATVMNWGWIRALKKQQPRTTIAIWHGIYKRAPTKESGGKGARTRETPI